MSAAVPDPLLPIACMLSPVDIAARRASLLPGLAQRASVVTTTPDGCSLTFAASAETLGAIVDTVDAERQCCRFLKFVLTIDPDGGPMTLQLSGPPGTREFLETMLQS